MNSSASTPTLSTQRNKFSALAEFRMFLTVWFGQVVSILGSTMTSFALGIYVYQQSGSATDFTLIFLFTMLPRALFAPLAGSLADRWNRRWIMILSDTGAGITTIAAAVLLAVGDLALWHIYVIAFINAIFNALQGPAYAAAVTQLVPQKHYGRMSGMVQLGEALGQILAPLFAGIVIGTIGLPAILAVDMLTFVFAVGTLLFVRFPAVSSSQIDTDESTPVDKSWKAGWHYLKARPGLLGLVLAFSLANYFIGNTEALLTPLILGFSTPDVLGLLTSIGGFGLLIGSLVMSVWGGGQRKIYTTFGFYAVLGVMVAIIGSTTQEIILAVALFIAFLSVPFLIGANNAIVMSKVEQSLQGRVFALRSMLNTGAFALAYLTSGPLADNLFAQLGGEGQGTGLMFIVMGVLVVITAMGGLLYTPIRRVEIDLPDVSE